MWCQALCIQRRRSPRGGKRLCHSHCACPIIECNWILCSFGWISSSVVPLAICIKSLFWSGWPLVMYSDPKKVFGHPKLNICHHLLTLVLFQITFLLLLNTKEDILKTDSTGFVHIKSVEFKITLNTIDFQCMDKKHWGIFHLLCSAEERKSYRFGMTWGRVNDDRCFIFDWTTH